MNLQLYKALRHPGKALGVAVYMVKKTLFWDRYVAQLREPKAEGPLPNSAGDYAATVAALKAAGFDVVPLRVDPAAYRAYLDRAEYARYPGYLAGGRDPRFPEKSLEHYLAAELLGITPDDVYIDVGNYESPTAEIYQRLYGCRAYRQDLAFPEGINGNIIGGDAASMPVPEGFAGKMALHCAFEHFEGDADARFIREAGRVLRPGGRLCIVPLYTAPEYTVYTDAVVAAGAEIPFEPDAVLRYVKGYRNRHGRHYDVAHLDGRIRKNLNGLELTIFVIENARDVDPRCYATFAALFTKP